ncbi:MAG: UDP-N-acetylglucosamine 1-carboxyvinyltransferase [Acidobacteria bacterium]|nr:MAG: UDP-N-acetylglucosamine 1-carboxyvinyltransferase [Acidobacteriota bacterium]REJ99341.1 MAG: UDP-N-acetylglucosamine 1-carboxyvinyltransferase [Acidobacteriota bacterium]REK15637.1 MAG: UDP-N-acetylglucosamine 1-carboxyvinyltransferase [Acidobacteriota bacterium]REK43620.1 MAG: UDP-N-acetylglucosamine 1-carboxyvinyltransferase [Acidobacteriota bacterium]
MDKFLIKGGNALHGRVAISGAKNSALPCLAATLLSSGTVTLHNVPYVRDLITQRRLLEDLGAQTLTPDVHTHRITASNIENFEAPYELVKTMRASVLALGPLLGRFGKAKVSLPGGCAIGTRPIDLHLRAFEELGAEVSLESGDVVARAPRGRLVGSEMEFEKVTVTGTENVMMAAVLAEGRSVIRNAACEPEIPDLADLLIKMGAKIEGAGTPNITIDGVEELGDAEHWIIADRIETGTFAVAAAITGGELEIANCRPDHIGAVIDKLRDAGVEIEEEDKTTLRVKRSSGGLKASDVTTEPYPEFPTDMQAQYMALMTQAEGTCDITETIFENRFMHASELIRMGASIEIHGNKATVSGAVKLKGAPVLASDLRASASLVLAGLCAGGETMIDRVYHIDRGYETIVRKLGALGANIERIKEQITESSSA